MEVVSYQVFSCGALTFNMSDGSCYSVQKRNLKRLHSSKNKKYLRGVSAMTLKEAFELEKKANRALKKFKEELYQRIGEADPLEGVHIPANAGSLRIAYVNLSTVLREKSLSPEAYIPAAQADIVRKALNSCSTIAELVLKISHIIQTGSVVLNSSGGKYTYRLNAHTLEVLKRSTENFNAEVA